MLKKRLIFILYYADGSFFLSRNFRLQKAGDVNWLLNRFRFSTIGRHIDELILLDVDRGNFNAPFSGGFWDAAQSILRTTFTPLTVGGGIRRPEDVVRCFQMGADKILLNSLLAESPDSVREYIANYGAQAVVAAIDVKVRDGEFWTHVSNGSTPYISLRDHLELAVELGVGEIMVNSIDRDGTGVGFVSELLGYLDEMPMPVILAGGAGKPEHFAEMLSDSRISAVATGNLFNFIGEGFSRVRQHLIDAKLPVRH